MSEPILDRAMITETLRRLGERLAYRGIVADLYVFGGAAMALAYDLRRSTRDVDALVQPHGAVLAEAEAVALELGLPRWWLNEQASAYVAPGADTQAPLVFDHPGLRVHAASAPHLLAMKVLAGRRRDVYDIRLLADHLGLRAAQEVRAVCADVFPDELLPKRSELLLEELFGDGDGRMGG
jgi:Nucleotidyltransferase of unknown function (DUF6036)